MPRCHLLLPRRSRGRGLQLKTNHPPPHPPAPAAHRAHPSIPLGGIQQNETWREHHLAPTPALGGPTAPLGISTTPAGAESAPGWEEKSWVPLAAPAWVSAEAPRVLWGSHAAPAPAPLLPLAAGAEPAARAAGSPHSPGPEFLPLLPQAGWLQPCEAAGDPGELLLRFPNDVAASCAGTPRLLSFPFLVHCAGDRILSPLFHRQPPFRRLPLPKKTKKPTPYSFCSPPGFTKSPVPRQGAALQKPDPAPGLSLLIPELLLAASSRAGGRGRNIQRGKLLPVISY